MDKKKISYLILLCLFSLSCTLQDVYKRQTYDETVEYICSELETAAAYLPLKASIAQFERPTKGAAYALIARLRLHAASPLFNGTSTARLYFGNWKRTYDKEYYVNQNYSEEKWALAAAACKRVIDMNVYELFTAVSYTHLQQ